MDEVRVRRQERENPRREDESVLQEGSTQSNPDNHKYKQTLDGDKISDISAIKCRYKDRTNDGGNLCSKYYRGELKEKDVISDNYHLRGSRRKVPLDMSRNNTRKHLDPWVAEQRRRKKRLRRVCAKWKEEVQAHMPTSIEELVHLLVDDNHRAIYCYVAKVGS